MSGQQSTEDRNKRRRLLLVIAAALALLVVILILIITQSGGDDGEQVDETDAPSTPTVAPTVAKTPSVSEGSGPIAQWMFDGNALDATGNGHDATVLGGAEYIGGAAEMDGTDDAFQVANAPDLNPADAITVAAWWNAVDFIGAGNNGLVDKGFTDHTPPFYQYHLGVTGTGYAGGSHFDFSVALDGTSVGTQYRDWTPGQLYHLVGTYDGSEVRLYVNGALEASRAASGSITDYGRDLLIGRYTNLKDEGVHFLPGAIDEVTIWDRALSADEIVKLYSTGAR